MKCTKHIEVDASGMCVYCGKPYCKDCLVEVDGKLYCKEDLTKVFKEAKTTNTNPNIVINNANSNLNTNSNINTNANANNAMWGAQKSKITALILCIDILRYGVVAGDLGGWIASESNLSQDDDCVVLDDA